MPFDIRVCKSMGCVCVCVYLFHRRKASFPYQLFILKSFIAYAEGVRAWTGVILLGDLSCVKGSLSCVGRNAITDSLCKLNFFLYIFFSLLATNNASLRRAGGLLLLHWTQEAIFTRHFALLCEMKICSVYPKGYTFWFFFEDR